MTVYSLNHELTRTVFSSLPNFWERGEISKPETRMLPITPSPLVCIVGLLALSACTSTYTGRIITRDGRAVSGAQIRALGYPSLLSTGPLNWYPAVYVRGTTISATDGSFSVRASQYRVRELQVRSSVGSAVVSKPSPRQPIIVTVQPNSQ
jgi:hypothetical protein